MKIAFDANVLIYSCDQSEPQRQAKALQLVESAEEAVTLWQTAVEFIAASRKLAKRGMTPDQAWDRLSRFLDAFPLVPPSASVLRTAKRLQLEQQWSFWDALVVSGCLEAGVRRLYSEDLPGRNPPPGLEIVNPFV